MRIRFLEVPSRNVRNGNVVTSERWRRFFLELGHTVLDGPSPNGSPCDLLVAFNASRNAHAIREAQKAGSAERVVVCLTGTDLYRDLKNDPSVLDVLDLADHLVVLQPMALRELPPHLALKTTVVYQSAQPPLTTTTFDPEHFDVCVIAHLREVKDPLRTAAAARLLPPASRIRVFHVGSALTEEFARLATAEAAANPRFHWLGELSGERTAEVLGRSRAMVLSSLSEGGANVVSEAVVAGIPVIATDIPCMRGLLGDDYPGLFPVGNTESLAGLLWRAETDRGFHDSL